MKKRQIKFFGAFLLVFFAGKFIDLSVNFSSDQFYNPATYQISINLSGYRSKKGDLK